MFLHTDVDFDSTLLEKKHDAARTLAMLSVEGPSQQHSDGSDTVLHWTRPLMKSGGKLMLNLLVIL